MEITKSIIKEKLQEPCWSLRNHGHGWHLYAPPKRHTKVACYPVEQALLDAMINAGELHIDIPYTAAVARLVTEPALSISVIYQRLTSGWKLVCEGGRWLLSSEQQSIPVPSGLIEDMERQGMVSVSVSGWLATPK